MNRIFCFFILFIIFFPMQNITYAQLPSISQGNFVRLTLTKYFEYPIIGKVQQISSDSLSLLIGNRIFKFSAAEIERIEIKEKLKRQTFEGALLGAASGCLILGAIFYSTGRDEPSYGPSFTKAQSAAMGAILGTFSGGTIGGLIGHSRTTKDWLQIFPERDVQNQIQTKKSPFLACAMSAMLPGLGQYYNRDIRKGIIQDILFVGGLVLAVKSSDDNSRHDLVGAGLALGSALWSLIDALISASKKNKSLRL